MSWYAYLAYFFAGAFLVNAVPHFVTGVTGRRFPTPFASPPGKGESSPIVNVLWAAVNLLIAYLLLTRVGDFQVREIPSVAAAAAGGLLMALQLSSWFGSTYGRQEARE
jgi:hypothetical protein